MVVARRAVPPAPMVVARRAVPPAPMVVARRAVPPAPMVVAWRAVPPAPMVVARRAVPPAPMVVARRAVPFPVLWKLWNLLNIKEILLHDDPPLPPLRKGGDPHVVCNGLSIQAWC